MLDALDALSDRLRRGDQWSDAIDATLLAVTTDPLRERSQVALIRAHLAEGNLSEARRAYDSYRRLLGTDIGIEPPTFPGANHVQPHADPARGCAALLFGLACEGRPLAGRGTGHLAGRLLSRSTALLAQTAGGCR